MRQKYSIGPVWFLMFACAFFTSCVTQGKKVQQEELSQYVEPRIGTAHCRWFHFTPGAMPFGMAKPAPSTLGGDRLRLSGSIDRGFPLLA